VASGQWDRDGGRNRTLRAAARTGSESIFWPSPWSRGLAAPTEAPSWVTLILSSFGTDHLLPPAAPGSVDEQGEQAPGDDQGPDRLRGTVDLAPARAVDLTPGHGVVLSS